MLKNQIETVLLKYDKNHHEQGIRANIRAWEENKGGLINLLSKHPAWNEQALAIIFDVTEIRGADKYTIDSLRYDLTRLLCQVSPDVAIGIETAYTEALQIAAGVGASSTLTENDAARITYVSGIKCVAGQKRSRTINKICQKYGTDKHADYNVAFAKLADALNPLTLERKALLSVHPCDFLEMSNRENSWKSCHNLDDGEWRAGPLSYLSDNCSMVFYTIDGDKVKHYYDAPKITRQIFSYSGGILLQSRLYPCTRDDGARQNYRNIVQHAIATCLDIPNFWELKTSREKIEKYIETHPDALHYPDYDYEQYYATVSLIKDMHVTQLTIGNAPLCLVCGDVVTTHESICCDDCGDDTMYFCHQCGAEIPAGYERESDGHYYCFHCGGLCHWCDHYHSTYDLTPAYTNDGVQDICPNCLDSHFIICEKCGEYIEDCDECVIRLGDEIICRDCYERAYYECDSCGNPVYHDDIIKIDCEYFCEHCAAEQKSA
jgi:hypothetical protein